MSGLPATGVPREEVLARLAELRSKDLAARGGRTFAYVYDPARPDIDDLGHEVYASYLDVNGLDPTVFPSLLMATPQPAWPSSTPPHPKWSSASGFDALR